MEPSRLQAVTYFLYGITIIIFIFVIIRCCIGPLFCSEYDIWHLIHNISVSRDNMSPK